MKRILSGMQPTYQLHLGNYLGALRNWVSLQHDYESLFCVVDLHALTQQPDPAELRKNTRSAAAAYIAAGIDPEKSAIFVQSHVRSHAELHWLLSCRTPLGWLNRMTQFKEKAGKKKDQANLGLYAYPVLMAADILIYQATHVPVGDDQKQHLELTREIANSFNFDFDIDHFTMPEPQIMWAATRVMSLRDGTKKMSKSDPSDASRINLTDDPDLIAKKIKKAKTDPLPMPEALEELEGRPEATNLINIYAALADTNEQAVLDDFGGGQFSQFKSALVDLAVEKLAPINTRMIELNENPDELDRILAKGAEKANTIAEENLRQVKEIMGLLPKA